MEQTLALGLAYLKSEHDIRIEDDLSKPLLDYVHLLHKWNRVYNLTAVRDLNAMVQRHLLDSLVLCRWLPEQTNASDRAADAQVDVIDVGSGAGLPVLPLAIVRPDLQFASIESNGKKTRFQQQALVELIFYKNCYQSTYRAVRLPGTSLCVAGQSINRLHCRA